MLTMPDFTDLIRKWRDGVMRHNAIFIYLHDPQVEPEKPARHEHCPRLLQIYNTHTHININIILWFKTQDSL